MSDWKTHRVTICDRCRQASCWQGIFMCWDARGAGTITVTAEQLMDDPRDHPDYWSLPDDAAREEAVRVYRERNEKTV